MMGGQFVRRRRFLGYSFGTLVGATLLGACASQANAVGSAASSSVAPIGTLSPQHVSLVVVPASARSTVGTDGAYHDAIVPSSFEIQVGRPVYLSIVNYCPANGNMRGSNLGKLARRANFPKCVHPSISA